MTTEVKALSLTERASLVRHAFYQAAMHTDMYIEGVHEVYDDHCIICLEYGKYARADYSIDEAGNVTPSAPDSWTPVTQEWVAPGASAEDAESEPLEDETEDEDEPEGVAMKAARLIAHGGTVKAYEGGYVGGYLVLFGDESTPDLHGDFFSKSTDFDLYPGQKTAIYYNHGLDNTLKRRKLGVGEIGVDDVGVWIRAQLDLRDEYERAIYDNLIIPGKTGWSSGTAGHLVELAPVKSGVNHITRWPLGLDASITPTPADPRQVIPTKSAEPEASPEAANAAGAAVKATPVIEITSNEETIMSENPVVTAAENADAVALKARLDDLNAKLEKWMAVVDSTPALRSAGYVTDDGGAADKNVKSLGDWLMAVKRGDVKRLNSVYKSFRTFDSDENSVKALAEDQGGTGGYLVPEEFQARLLQVGTTVSPILSSVTTIPVTTSSGKVPALDSFFTPTAGVGTTALAGGVSVSSVAEGGAFGTTEPSFEMIQWQVGKIGNYIKASDELLADSAIMLETLLAQLIGIAIGAKTEYYVLRGNGVNVPLGILNSDCAIGVTPNTDNLFAYVDANTMLSRFKPVSANARPRWLIHKSIIPDIGAFEVGTGGAVWMANPTTSPSGVPLLGYDIVMSEHLPKANSSGCVILADLGAYLLFERGALSIAYSEHADFLNGNGVWRFERRLDGKPWLKSAITDANPGGSYTESPFVYLND